MNPNDLPGIQGGGAGLPSSQSQPDATGMAVTTEDNAISPVANKIQEIEQSLGRHIDSLAPSSGLVGWLDRMFWERRNRRLPLEREWLQSYQRFLGQYPAEIKKAMDPRRSQIWVGLTAMYCNAAHSAIMDMIRGAGDEQSWSLEPEKIPDNTPIPPELEEQGFTVVSLRKEMRKRVEAMSEMMVNQLDDTRYEEQLDLAVYQGVITGSGAMKGPETVVDNGYHWNMNLDLNMQATPGIKQHNGHKPAYRHVSILNLYPDMDSVNVEDGAGIFEEMMMTRRQLMELAIRPGFNPAAVIRCLREAPSGDYTLLPHQVELQAITGDAIPHLSHRYRVRRYVGEVAGEQLHQAGAKVPRETWQMAIQADVWFCGPYMIRGKMHNGPIPYYIFPFSRRPTTPFGRGVPMLSKHSQNAINGAARAIMDNAAVASGPIMEINTRIVELTPGKDPSDIQGWDVYLSDHEGLSGTHAIKVHDFPAKVDQFLKIFEKFMQIMEHETFLPMLMQGQTRQGMTKTLGGMSMLQTNASKTIKKVLRYIDDYMVEPLVRALYDWNMRFNPDQAIMVPAKIRAKGTLSILSNEVLTQRMMQLLQVAIQHPDFKFDEAINIIGKAMGVPMNRLVFSDEEKQMMMMEAEAANAQNPPTDGPVQGGQPQGNQEQRSLTGGSPGGGDFTAPPPSRNTPQE